MRKYIADIITSLRIFGAVALLFIRPLTLPFYIVYTVCGVSDAIDGFVARRLHAESRLGGVLDSISDLTFYAVMLIRLMPILMSLVPGWLWTLVIILISARTCVYLFAAFKFKQFSSLHTVLNKVTGVLVFGIPYFIKTPFFTAYTCLVVAAGFAGTVHEMILHIRKPAAEEEPGVQEEEHSDPEKGNGGQPNR